MSEFRAAALAGLAHRPAVIPARFLYDAEGSRLFEEITRLPEYYPTRTEIGILSDALPELAEIARGRTVVEFGSGSSEKTAPLLRALGSDLYVPVDISPSALEGAGAMLADSAPGVRVEPIVADFMGAWDMPPRAARRALLGFFPGSTIGNLSPPAAVDLLRAIRARLGPDALFLIGLDRRKNAATLEAAYDDAAGVTAAFNLNLLARMQGELGAELALADWTHRAIWCDPPGRVEMHLVAERDTTINLEGERFAFGEGDSIHTENSSKYTPEEAAFLGRASGWEPLRHWTDAENRFMMQLWSADPGTPQP